MEPVLPEPGGNVTAAGWEVYPEGLRHVLTRLNDEYQQPKLYVTENGAAYRDSADVHGEVHDADQVRYLRAHLEAARQSMSDGVPPEGYFVWSLLDNFEWAQGYTQRFGVMYTDFSTQRRIYEGKRQVPGTSSSH